MNNPYSPPSSSLESENAVTEVEESAYLKRTLFPSFLILSSIYVSSTFIGGEHKSLVYEISAIFSELIYGAAIIYLLHNMANLVTSSGTKRYFGIWGFVWRAFATQIASLPILAIMMWIFRIDPDVAKESALFAALSGVIQILASAPVIWALFSNNRKLQLYWLLRHIGRA